MQVNISPRLEKPTIYFSGFDKRTGAELAGRLGRETCLVCLIASISVAGVDQATGERNAGASHDHIMQMSTLSQGVGSERGCSLRSFFNCKCSPIQCFPGRKSFKISTKQKSPWSRLQVAKAGANMREKMRQNVLTMLRPLEKVNQQSGRWSCNIIIGRRQRIRMRRSARPTRNLNKRTSMWSFPSWPGRCRRTGRRAKRRWWTSLCLPSRERRRRRMPPSALRRGSGESR